MLILSSEGAGLQRPRRFVYDARWGKKEECRALIKEAWRKPVMGSMAFQVREKLKGTRGRLDWWRRMNKPNSKRKIEELWGEIRRGMVDPLVWHEDIKEKEKELISAIKEEEVY